MVSYLSSLGVAAYYGYALVNNLLPLPAPKVHPRLGIPLISS